jgi:hypothetical protein
MAFEIISTQSWGRLGDFDDERAAQEAVKAMFAGGGARPMDLLLLVYNGENVERELTGEALIEWAGVALHAHV